MKNIGLCLFILLLGVPDPPVIQRIFWAFTEGATATALLVAGGKQGLVNLNNYVQLKLKFLSFFSVFKNMQKDVEGICIMYLRITNKKLIF